MEHGSVMDYGSQWPQYFIGGAGGKGLQMPPQLIILSLSFKFISYTHHFHLYPSPHPPLPLSLVLPEPWESLVCFQSELLLHLISSALCCFACTIGRSRGPLLGRICCLLTLIFSLCATLGRTDFELVQDPLDPVGNRGKYALWRSRCAMPEIVCIASGCRSKFLSRATLISGYSIRVEVVLQFGIRPGVKR